MVSGQAKARLLLPHTHTHVLHDRVQALVVMYCYKMQHK
jgi:hypothetical protein